MFCGGVLWWCFCDGVVVVFLWWFFCGGGGVFVVVWWCFCGGVFVVVWRCFCGGVFVFLWWCFFGQGSTLKRSSLSKRETGHWASRLSAGQVTKMLKLINVGDPKISQ